MPSSSISPLPLSASPGLLRRVLRALGAAAVSVVRKTGRFLVSRRMAWALVVFASLITLGWQYENWNGAREIAAAREKMIARAGTDNVLDLLARPIPREENFYASPLIESWTTRHSATPGDQCTVFPAERLLPDGFVLPPQPEWADGQSRLMYSPEELEAWRAVLDAGQDIVTGLAEGLDRPGAQAIPARYECVAAAGGDPGAAQITGLRDLYSFVRTLSFQARVAALTGQGKAAAERLGICLRLGESMTSDCGTLVHALIASVMNSTALAACEETLACQIWDEPALARLQSWLTKAEDLKGLETGLLGEMLTIYSNLRRARTEDVFSSWPTSGLTFMEWQEYSCSRWGPVGWLDCNAAFAVERSLELCGLAGEDYWRVDLPGHAARVMEAASGFVVSKRWDLALINPRRTMGCFSVPAMSNLHWNSADNSFHRRAATLVCALERHRLAHGAWPDDLSGLDPSFLRQVPTHPGRPGVPLRYERSADGFRIWAPDTSGAVDRTWLWRFVPVTAATPH